VVAPGALEGRAPHRVGERNVPRVDEVLFELAEEPGLWLPPGPQLEIARRDGYAFVVFGRSAWVHRIRLDAARLHHAVDEVRDALRARGLPEVTWWLGERSTPRDLGERLLARGLEPDDPPELTTLTIASRPAGVPTVEVRRVETLDDLLVALEIDWESFAVPDEERATRRSQTVEAWPLIHADRRQSTYLGYADGEPVGFGRAVFTPQAAILLGGATLPAARGRGVYTSIVHARWDEAVERGVPRIVVSAGPISAPVLERLGFVPIGRVLLLRDRA
jgi:GNAT superfamily N-acetyltransferase